MNYDLIRQWNEAAQHLTHYKDLEMKLRKQVFAHAFQGAQEGVNEVDLENEWTLKATVPYTRTLDQAKVPDVLKALKKAKAPETLIKTKYELGIADYRKLDDDTRAIVDAILTTKPGTPALELHQPK